jgi:hypothetical protein
MPVAPKPGEEADPPSIDLSEDVFAEEAAPVDTEPESSAQNETPTSDEPVEGSDEAAPEPSPAPAEAE